MVEGNGNIIYRENIEKIKKLLEMNIPGLLIGEAGMGKSFSGRIACSELEREHESINLSKQTDLVDLLGQFVLKNNETVWVDQKVTSAAKEGKVLILEELTMSEPTILAALHGLIEIPPKLHTLDGDVDVHEDFRVIGTANPHWTNYQGVSELNYAFEDRFAHIVFDFPNETDFRTLLRPYAENMSAAGLDMRHFYSMASEIYGMYPERTGSYISLRGAQFFCQLLDAYDKREAIEMAYVNKVHPNEKNGVLDIIDKYIPLGRG